MVRAHYGYLEDCLHRHYEIYDGDDPAYQLLDIPADLETLPSELPWVQPGHGVTSYIIDLDREVLTVEGVHWKLCNIPRRIDLWPMDEDDYFETPKDGRWHAFPADISPEDHMVSLALELTQPIKTIGYDNRIVRPKTSLEGVRNMFLAHVLDKVSSYYEEQIILFGREWSPDSFPFRELSFVLISIASGQVKFSAQLWACQAIRPPHDHFHRCGGFFSDGNIPLLEFSQMFHRPGEPPGVSPTETMYWFQDVLVSLVLVVDGEAITKAVAWGIEQGRTNFQIMVLSLFDVAFAEATFTDDKPFVKATAPIKFSNLEYSPSVHLRERPVWKSQTLHYWANRGRTELGALAAMVNFFDAAASRRATSRRSNIPVELCARILDFADFDTWRACEAASDMFRSCRSKYMIADWTSITELPPATLRRFEALTRNWPSYGFVDTSTGAIIPMVAVKRDSPKCSGYNLCPIISGSRGEKELMSHATLQLIGYDALERLVAEYGEQRALVMEEYIFILCFV